MVWQGKKGDGTGQEVLGMGCFEWGMKDLLEERKHGRGLHLLMDTSSNMWAQLVSFF